MNARMQPIVRPLSAILLIAGVLALAAGGGAWAIPGRSALAQSVPGGGPPTDLAGACGLTMPDNAIPISPSAPFIKELPPGAGVAQLVTFPPSRRPGQATRASIAMCPETLQNLTDGSGNDVDASKLVIQLAGPPSAGIPLLPPGEINLSEVLQIQLLDMRTPPQVIDHPNFNPPAIVCFTPTSAQVQRAGGIDSIKVKTFDGLTGQWETLASAVIGGQVCASVTHLSLFTLAVAKGAPVPGMLPNTGGASAPRPEMLLAAALLLVFGGLALREAEASVYPNVALGLIDRNHLPRTGSRSRRCSRSAIAS